MKRVVNLVDFVCVILAGHRYTSFLDLGCGSGNFCRAVKQVMPELDVQGIDICTPFIKQAKSFPGGVQFRKGDIRKLPYKKKQFDFCLTHGVFIHIPPRDVLKAMKEALRVSKNFLFLESSLNLNEKGWKPYDCEKYWNSRAFKPAPSPKDTGVIYYFAHDYRRLFEKLGVEVEIAEIDPTSNSRMYMKCKPNLA